MATDLTVGDADLPELDVTPFDGTTNATLVAMRPDGTTVAVPVAVLGVTDDVQTWVATSALVYDQAGWWVLLWTVTGTGLGVGPQRVYVALNPAAGGPTWTPTRQRVADFIPHRTIPEAYESQGQPLFDFTDDTTPRGYTVDRLIVGAVGWVLAATGDLHASQADAAQECAALRAAGFVELAGRPTVDRDLANALFAQADAALKALAARNRALTGADGDDPTPEVALMPVYSFPPAPSWGDTTF